MIAEIPSYMFPRIKTHCAHIATRTQRQRQAQYIEQDKPLHAVRGWCVIGLCGAAASLIINSSELMMRDHAKPLSIVMKSKTCACTYSQMPNLLHTSTHTLTSNTSLITTITKRNTYKQTCAVCRSKPDTKHCLNHFA